MPLSFCHDPFFMGVNANAFAEPNIHHPIIAHLAMIYKNILLIFPQTYKKAEYLHTENVCKYPTV